MAKDNPSGDVVSLIFVLIGALAGMFLLFVIVTDDPQPPSATAPPASTVGEQR